MTLTYIRDLDRVMMNQHANCHLVQNGKQTHTSNRLLYLDHYKWSKWKSALFSHSWV